MSKNNFETLSLNEGDELIIEDERDSIFQCLPQGLNTIRVVKEYPYFIQVQGIKQHFDGDKIIPFAINKADIYCGSTVVRRKFNNKRITVKVK